MLISPQEYLDLTDQIVLLNTKNKLIESENQKLTEEILKLRQAIRMLNQKLQNQNTKQQQFSHMIMTHIQKTNSEFLAQLNLSSQQEMRCFQQQVNKIRQDTNFQKVRQIEKKMTETRLLNHDMVDFYQKIQSLYMVLNKTKNKPKMIQLYKWTSIRKAQQLQNLFTTSNYIQGTQKSLLTAGKIPNKKPNGGSKTSILKQKVEDVETKNKQNSETNVPTIKKSQKRKYNVVNQENVESYQNLLIKDKTKLQVPKVKNKSVPKQKEVQKMIKFVQNSVNILETESLTQVKNEQNESFTVDILKNNANMHPQDSTIKIVI